ncbi:unnamed protein product [Spirodela intermedia]|uniref:non-specific serine/threonine protein kinase n=1 Tax=Spirodela intermedia TaxID=51605 RepID=A0A7I8LGK3_SPIIN|nr:unnamed protein product [Spirodela intermedia]
MGFFSPSGSKNRYLGIWFKKVQVQNVLWVANRGRPLEDSSGVLKFSETGNLIVVGKAGVVVWSFVIRDENRNQSSGASYLWQSFDEPGDTLIAGMRLGVNKKTGATRHLTSWKSTADPSPGNFTMRMNIRNLPHVVLLEGNTVRWNSGPWNGVTFSGLPDINSTDMFLADYLRDTTGGCVRKVKLQCGGDGFLQLQGMKMPDTKNSTVKMNMTLEECHESCLNDCSCTANSSAYVRNTGTGCVTWFGDLMDIRIVANGQEDLYIRVPGSVLAKSVKGKSKRNAALVASAIVVFSLFLGALCGLIKLILIAYLLKVPSLVTDKGKKHIDVSIAVEDSELPLMEYKTIVSATKNFSLRNKNLVRLLGCCNHGEERMLIYEFMENSSLDRFIFDQEIDHYCIESGRRTSDILDWSLRSDIILGVARGLMYLHHDSRFKIIHRDLKASNILLDEAMNPKISDFGTARIFGEHQTMENTRRVIATYSGYMSPEYDINGIISLKSDVFSFGVLVLEILSCQRNGGIYESQGHLNLLSHVSWKLWLEGDCLGFLDETIRSSSNPKGMVTRGFLVLQPNNDSCRWSVEQYQFPRAKTLLAGVLCKIYGGELM